MQNYGLYVQALWLPTRESRLNEIVEGWSNLMVCGKGRYSLLTVATFSWTNKNPQQSACRKRLLKYINTLYSAEQFKISLAASQYFFLGGGWQ